MSLPEFQTSPCSFNCPTVHGRARYTVPSTHILKVDDPRHRDPVVAEADCLRIVYDLGLTSIQPELGTRRRTVRDRQTIRSASRTGKARSSSPRRRLPSAESRPGHTRGYGKYGRAGGPSLVEIAGLLDVWSVDSTEQRSQLLRAATLKVVVGNADAQGKNIALLYPSMNGVELAPLFDVVPTVWWPNRRQDMATSVNDRTHGHQITASDLEVEAIKRRLSERVAHRIVSETIEAARTSAQCLNGDSGVREFVEMRSTELLETYS